MKRLTAGIATGVLLLFFTTAIHAEDAVAWASAIGKARAEAMQYTAAHGSNVLYRSEKKSGKEGVEKISVDVSEAEVLWLKTDSANDRNDFDLTAWTGPVLVSKDGVTTSLFDLKPFHAECATNKVKEIKIRGGKRALLAHASSRIGYRLDGEYTRFNVWTGFDTKAKKFGRAVFEVNTIATGVNPAEFRKSQWEQLAQDFPAMSDALLTNFGEKECLKLLETTNQVLNIEALIRAALGPHAPDVPAGTLASCGESLAQLIKLYEARRAIRRLGGFTFPLIHSPIKLSGLRETIRSDFDMSTELELLKKTALLEEKLRAAEAKLMAGATVDTAGLKPLADEVNRFIREVSIENGWSSFRGGNGRRAVTQESPILPLHPKWVHKAVSPRPAWPAPARENISAKSAPLTDTLTFDRAHHTAVWMDSVYYGSSADDAVRCLDAATGRLKWIFTTEGPVRLTPVVKRGMVYAASDDGYVYCLDAAKGTLVWKYSPAPDARRVPGNGRMISIVPVRAGICVADGTVYFAAGLFPNEGAYLCAVDAVTGEQVFRQKLDISPQGAMLLTPDRIMVPTGRTPLVMYDRKRGEKINKVGKSNPWSRNLTGGSFAVADGDHVVIGPSEDGHFHLFGTAKKEKVIRLRGIQMAMQGDTAYVLKKSSLTAIDRNRYFEFKHNAEKWRASAPTARTMILAGPVVFVGGENRIIAYSTDGGRELWQTRTPGTVESLAFNGQRLYASFTDGSICCFSPVASPKVAIDQKDLPPFQPKGYCLIAGKDDVAQLALAMVQSGMQTLCVEPDPRKALELIIQLRQAGIYGQAVVHINNKPHEKLPYTKYFANIVIGDESSGIPKEELLRVLRPAGGKGWLGADEKVFVRPPLEGAGEWTHMYADAGNTAMSNDRVLRYAHTGVQWFGRPGPVNMVDRHQKTPAPLYKNGRMFIAGFDYLAGLDAYNGTVLWEGKLPLFGRRNMSFNCGSIALDDRFLYAAAGNRCLMINPQTGQTVHEIKLPEGSEWGYVARAGDMLLGSMARAGNLTRPRSSFVKQPPVATRLPAQKNAVSCSDALFACSPKDGKQVWEYNSGGLIIHPAIGASDHQVVFVECANPELRRGERRSINIAKLTQQDMFLTALAVETGKVRWRRPVDFSAIQNIIYLSMAEETVVVTGSKHEKTRDGLRNRYDLFAFRAADGELLWHNTNVPANDDKIADHGSDVQHPSISDGVVYGTGFARMLHTGEEYTGWKWEKSHKCGTVSMSENCAFSRHSKGKFPYIFDKATGDERPLSVVSRPGCWINMLPAGGLILIPEASSGCTCEYSIQTSMALINLDD